MGKKMSTKQPIIYLLETGNVCEGKQLGLSLILYLSIKSSYWPLLQTGLSRLDLFSDSVWIWFKFLTKIKDNSKTERSKVVLFISTCSVFTESRTKNHAKGNVETEN